MDDFKNTLYYGDNIEVLKEMHASSEFRAISGGGIDLIYIDPPFNSKRKYNMPYETLVRSAQNAGSKNKAQMLAFNDTWSNVEFRAELELLKGCVQCQHLHQYLSANQNIFGTAKMSYLTIMAHRLYYMWLLLKDTGSIYLHCDPHMSHYLKVMMDMIFGEKNFRNEIVWCYKRWTNVSSDFQRMHDVILKYSKTENYVMNKLCIEASKSKKACIERGWSTNTVQNKNKRITQLLVYDKEKFDAAVAAKSIDAKKYEKIVYVDTAQVIAPDVWNIPILNSQAKERLGYPTQKPEELLERIIMASTNEGGIVADFFCGCGTAVAVAQKLGRKWIGVDINHTIISEIERRRLQPLGAKYELMGFPKDMAMAEKLALQDRFKFEQWIVGHVFRGYQTKKTGDGGIDGHIIYDIPSRGGKIRRVQAIMEVKSGKVAIAQVRAFCDSLAKYNADFGIFVAFGKYITDGMREEANRLGYIEISDLFGRIKKMYIITIEDIFAENLPSELTEIAKNVTYF